MSSSLDRDWKDLPLPTIRSAVAGVVAAALVLAGEPGHAVAAVSADAPPQSLPASPAVERSAAEAPVVPTMKLEGELKSQFQKAQDAGSVQDFDKALKLYNQVVKYAPGYVYAWSNRANVLIAKGDLPAALSDYGRAIELAENLSMPDKWVIFLNRGTTLLAMGEEDRALADLNEAAGLTKRKDVFVLANRAQALERKGSWDKALADYEGAITVQPGSVQPWWIRYGLVLFQEGRDFDSLACLRRLQSKFEGVAEVQAAVTAVQFGRGEMRDAEKAWAAVNRVEQQKFMDETYLREQLRWPPRVIESLREFNRETIRDDS